MHYMYILFCVLWSVYYKLYLHRSMALIETENYTGKPV